MGRVGQDWLVLTQLTDHSSSALGIVTGLQFLPFLILAPVTGMIADRFSKRHILLTTQSFLGLSALALAALTLTGHVELWHVYLIAFLQGVATAVDNPARQSFVSEMVPEDRLSNAVALNSASFNAGRLIGPAVAGLVIAALGTGGRCSSTGSRSRPSSPRCWPCGSATSPRRPAPAARGRSARAWSTSGADPTSCW